MMILRNEPDPLALSPDYTVQAAVTDRLRDGFAVLIDKSIGGPTVQGVLRTGGGPELDAILRDELESVASVYRQQHEDGFDAFLRREGMTEEQIAAVDRSESER